MSETYEPINSDEIRVITTSEQIVLVQDLQSEKLLIQSQIDRLAEDMAVVDSKLAVLQEI